MRAALMNGSYYEFVGRYLDSYAFKKAEYISKAEAKAEALNTENDLYYTKYIDGKLKSVKVLVGNPDMLDYPRTIGNEYYEQLPEEMRFRYSMLGRLESDCKYFLDGHNLEKFLWAGTVEKQIEEMRRRWNEFEEDEKPEWLTMEDIDEYEREMLRVRRIPA